MKNGETQVYKGQEYSCFLDDNDDKRYKTSDGSVWDTEKLARKQIMFLIKNQDLLELDALISPNVIAKLANYVRIMIIVGDHTLARPSAVPINEIPEFCVKLRSYIRDISVLRFILDRPTEARNVATSETLMVCHASNLDRWNQKTGPICKLDGKFEELSRMHKTPTSIIANGTKVVVFNLEDGTKQEYKAKVNISVEPV